MEGELLDVFDLPDLPDGPAAPVEDELLDLLFNKFALPDGPAVPVAIVRRVVWPQCKCGNYLNLDVEPTTGRECFTCRASSTDLRFGYGDSDDGDGDADEHLEEEEGDSEGEKGAFENDEEEFQYLQEIDDDFDGYLERADGPNDYVATAPVTPPTRRKPFDHASPPPSPSTEARAPMRHTDAELEAMIE